MNVGGLDDGSGFRVESVAGEGASEVVAAEDVGLETRVAALLLAGFVFGGLFAEGGDFRSRRGWQTETGAEHDLLLGREVDRNEGFACLTPEVRIGYLVRKD
jgi:hypothetical protein